MLNKKTYNIFNYASMTAIVVLLVLMFTKTVPTESNVYILGFAFLILILRIVFRLIVSSKINK